MVKGLIVALNTALAFALLVVTVMTVVYNGIDTVRSSLVLLFVIGCVVMSVFVFFAAVSIMRVRVWALWYIVGCIIIAVIGFGSHVMDDIAYGMMDGDAALLLGWFAAVVATILELIAYRKLLRSKSSSPIS